MFKKLQSVYNQIPLDYYIRLSQQKLILPFYHTVSSNKKPHFSEGNYFRTKDFFLSDLAFFTSNFESVPIEKISRSSKNFHLTFDDGMSEVYTEVFPVLQEKKIHATFFINSDFIDNRKMFFKHKINLLWSELKNSSRNRSMISERFDIEEHKIRQRIFTLSENDIDNTAKNIGLSFEDYLAEKQPYLTLSQLKELKKAGFAIGNHGKNHINFRELNFTEQKESLNMVNDFLMSNELADELYFCFPYGDHKIEKTFFNWMYNDGKISKSFGVAGLKYDEFPYHFHRILMEKQGISAQEIIKFEYFYFLLKYVVNKNTVRR